MLGYKGNVDDDGKEETMQALDEILKQAQSEIQSAADLSTLDQYRVKYLGKKGQLTEYLKTLGQLPADQRPAAGQKINAAKVSLQAVIEQKATELKQTLIASQLASESIDVTLPGRAQAIGNLHPISKTVQSLRNIFTELGFDFVEGPEIEDDYHNFVALNIPPLHPARAMQATFYFPDGKLLRTHTSPVQVRAMKDMALPMRIVIIGKVYRRDFDMTHTPMFHQMECLVIDENVTMADLKGLLTLFLRAFFSEDVRIRFRASYFPFTEPSGEVDISCLNCQGSGCRICKHTGWLEVLGCGMVHPAVLKMSGIDSERYRGFAIGAGLDRLAMLKYGITDLRSLFENDLRLLNQ